jgi:probable rRNA maturation factor
MAAINFFCEGIVFNLKSKTIIRHWLQEAASREGFSIRTLNFIFTSDKVLLGVNRQYLHHDFLTDIITFDNSDFHGEIEGDIFISIPRVKDNATQFRSSFKKELARVLVHGLLHLIGYSDKTPRKKKEMSEKEDLYLSLLKV